MEQREQIGMENEKTFWNLNNKEQVLTLARQFI